MQIASTAGKVVNLLNVDVPPSDPQILLKVRFVSVDRTKEQQLGINIFSPVSATRSAEFPPDILPPAITALTGGTSAGGPVRTN